MRTRPQDGRAVKFVGLTKPIDDYIDTLVHPAAAMPSTAKRNGAYLVEINIEPTPLTEYADFAMKGKSGEILPEIVKKLKK